MTSAAAPAMSGADSLVPRMDSVGYCGGAPPLPAAQAASPPYQPGATRFTSLPVGAAPPDERAAIWVLTDLWSPSSIATRRKLSTAPAAITAGSSAAEMTVPEAPLSPADSTTVTPAL